MTSSVLKEWSHIYFFRQRLLTASAVHDATLASTLKATFFQEIHCDAWAKKYFITTSVIFESILNKTTKQIAVKYGKKRTLWSFGVSMYHQKWWFVNTNNIWNYLLKIVFLSITEIFWVKNKRSHITICNSNPSMQFVLSYKKAGSLNFVEYWWWYSMPRPACIANHS